MYALYGCKHVIDCTHNKLIEKQGQVISFNKYISLDKTICLILSKHARELTENLF